MRLLVTGGAGFVGSNLAIRLREEGVAASVVALDNLRRRGSELAPERLAAAGVEFVHGDIRNREDIEAIGSFDLIIECSAEPSVQAGYGGGTDFVVNTNLMGTFNCLEAARRSDAALLFLSTSRVYPIAALKALPLERNGRRFEIPSDRSGPGWSAAGVSEDFPLSGSRSLYGATKLCSEHLIEEYRSMFNLRAVVNRCSVITGPWQMGKVDQGFFVLWAARHLFGKPLSYHGFGGEGLQVRDVLHIDDLCALVVTQLRKLESHDGKVYNVGGGIRRSVSLAELTDLCRQAVGQAVPISARAENHPSDVPFYVSDNSAVTAATGWEPRRSVETMLDDVVRWLRGNRDRLEDILL